MSGCAHPRVFQRPIETLPDPSDELDRQPVNVEALVIESHAPFGRPLDPPGCVKSMTTPRPMTSTSTSTIVFENHARRFSRLRARDSLGLAPAKIRPTALSSRAA